MDQYNQEWYDAQAKVIEQNETCVVIDYGWR